MNGSNNKIFLTAIIIEDEVTGYFTGTFKEIEGVVVQGKSEAEVSELLPHALNSVLAVRKELQDGSIEQLAKAKPGKIMEREFAFSY